jgi:hypothetical protein
MFPYQDRSHGMTMERHVVTFFMRRCCETTARNFDVGANDALTHFFLAESQLGHFSLLNPVSDSGISVPIASRASMFSC